MHKAVTGSAEAKMLLSRLSQSDYRDNHNREFNSGLYQRLQDGPKDEEMLETIKTGNLIWDFNKNY